MPWPRPEALEQHLVGRPVVKRKQGVALGPGDHGGLTGQDGGAVGDSHADRFAGAQRDGHDAVAAPGAEAELGLALSAGRPAHHRDLGPRHVGGAGGNQRLRPSVAESSNSTSSVWPGPSASAPERAAGGWRWPSQSPEEALLGGTRTHGDPAAEGERGAAARHGSPGPE